jgi:hypothetical protein
MPPEPRRRLELGDLIIFFYIAVFVRQYLWPIGNNWVAWSLTALFTALVWLLHWRTKEPAEPPAPLCFWVVIALPIFGFYALRAALPDLSWDVLDFRLMNGERGLRGWPLLPGDFFPSRFPFNPAPDMVMGLSRHLLGYRLGTLINLSIILWVGSILERMLRPFVRRGGLRCFCVLLLVLTEHLLFEVNNYMTDLLALPLLLETVRLALITDDHERPRRICVRAGLYLGAALAFKLTTLAFVIPILLIFAWRMMTKEMRFDLNAVLLGLVAMALPLLPYSLYIYWQTGNPVFPLYNWIFKSPYWPVVDLRTERWGPIVDDPRFKNMKAWEILLWPLLHPFRVENTAGDLGPHLGRISVGFVSAFVCIFLRPADRRVRMGCFLVLTGSVLWSAASGMLRYATFLELAGGTLALYLISILWRPANEIARTLLSRTIAVLLCAVLLLQSASACIFGYRFEWGSRPTFLKEPRKHLQELRHLLSDRNAREYLPAKENALIEAVDVWVESGPMTPGVQLLLTPGIPQICVYMPEFFTTEEARRKFAQALEGTRGKQLATLCMAPEFKTCTEHIQRAGLGVGKITAVSLPFFSKEAKFATSWHMEILRPEQGGRQQFSITSAGAPLAGNDFKASFSWAEPPPSRLKPGEQRSLRILVTNTGRATWPAFGQKGNHGQILIGNHWLEPGGRIVVNDDGRASIPYDLPPGDSIELLLTVNALKTTGEYILEIDALQEGISWRGLDTLRSPANVAD